MPETYAWLDKIEKDLNIKIERVGEDLESVIYDQGMLPSQRARFCTRLSKIYPMQNSIGKDPATVYFGIRFDEMDRVGYNNSTAKNIIPKYPLQDVGIDLKAVYDILLKHDLLPPTFFWQELYDRVVINDNVLAVVNRIKSKSRWVFDRLFSWRSRTNCYHCFYQRRYEWVGLLCHHPDLFARAKKIESDIGSADRREKKFYWIGSDFPLSVFEEKKEYYIAKHVKNISKLLDPYVEDLKQYKLDFPGIEYSNLDLYDNIELAFTKSCGLFCGK